MSNGHPASPPPVEARRPARRGGRGVELVRRILLGLRPNQRLKPTREGRVYVVIWLALLAIGLYQQSNLVLLTAGLAAGPVAASVVISASMLRRLAIERRAPAYVFAGEPLALDYILENGRRHTAALALIVDDELTPTRRIGPEADRLRPRVVFPRVPARGRGRLRWQADSPPRGRYRFTHVELVTRSPFGLWERALTLPAPGELVVYPRVGTLSRRWLQVQRESTETTRGRRHDRSANQLEYHGLRDYRPGDSPRWIHWRTTARLGQPMVKEFEQQSDQDVAVLIDPWLPRFRAAEAQRDALEAAVSFAATLCLEICRRPGRRLLLGSTGPAPAVLQGSASIRLLHEILAALAVLPGAHEGRLSDLFDALPPQALRESMFFVVSTRPVNLVAETERSHRLHGASGRGLAARVVLIDVARGDLDGLIQFDDRPKVARRDRDPAAVGPDGGGAIAATDPVPVAGAPGAHRAAPETRGG